MVIRVVQNKEENHLEEVKDLLANSNEALIASPFISLAAIDKMKNWLTSGFQELTLVTTLKEKDPDQLKKVCIRRVVPAEKVERFSSNSQNR